MNATTTSPTATSPTGHRHAYHRLRPETPTAVADYHGALAVDPRGRLYPDEGPRR
jgi:hypothetical protein